jgi:Cu-processing system permease protein
MKVLSIAGITLREALRRKVHVNLLLFGILMVGVSYVVSTLTLGEMHRIISDLGLSSMALIGSLIAVFLGAASVAGDIERRVVYPVVAKPVSRSQYVVGRYLGLSAALLLNLAAMAAALAAILVFDAGSARVLDAAFWAAVALIGVQLLVVSAVAVLFSAITTTTLAAIFALAITIAGQLTNDMRNLWRGDGAWLGKALWYALPNLGSLTANEAVIYHRPLPPAAWLAAAYGLLYAALAVSLACAVFERRDFR